MGYRKKTIEQAKQLASKGFSARQIADRLSKDKDANINYGNIIRSPDERTVRYWLKKERNIQEYPLTEEMREHDREVFKKSDEILNEDRLDKLINRLLIGNRYYFEEIVMLFRYVSFFEKESYKYVIPNLRQQCVRCCKMIDRLSHFIEIHSYYLEVDDDELGMKHKLIAGGDYDRFYNNLIDGQIQKVERIFSNKADRIARECRDAYKEYRSIVRETLYL